MSAPFEFDYRNERGNMDLDKTPELGRLLDRWVTNEYNENEMVFGILAFDDNKTLVDIRVESHGTMLGPEDFGPVETNNNPWPVTEAWLADLGVTNFMTFVRRAPMYGHGVQPGDWDLLMIQTVGSLATDSELTWQGHLITTGTEHGLIAPESFGRLSPEMKARITQMSADALRKVEPNIDQSVFDAIDIAVRAFANGEQPTPEEAGVVNRALRALEDKLAEQRAPRPKGPMDVPDITTRPDVPRAFYN